MRRLILSPECRARKIRRRRNNLIHAEPSDIWRIGGYSKKWEERSYGVVVDSQFFLANADWRVLL